MPVVDYKRTIPCNWCDQPLYAFSAKYFHAIFYHWDCFLERQDSDKEFNKLMEDV